jgi:hypothetical protein
MSNKHALHKTSEFVLLNPETSTVRSTENTMPTLQLNDSQVVDLVGLLPTHQQMRVLKLLAEGAGQFRDERRQLAEARLAALAAARTLDWQSMNDVDREAMIDDLIHEDRTCGK